MRLLRRSKVVTFVRHAATCPHFEDESYPRCDCSKWLRWSRAGKQHRQAANTRTWGAAEKAAAQLQERLNAGESPATSAAVAQPTIAALAETFLQRKLSEGIVPSTERKVRYQVNLFEQFLTSRGKVYPTDITPTDIVAFKAGWGTWKRSVTKQKAQINIRGFIRFVSRGDRRDELLEAFGKVKETRADTERLEPKPFTEEELKKLLAQVPITFPDPIKAARLTALIHLQVSTGLAIRDAVQLEITDIKDGRLSIRRQKTDKGVTQRLDPDLHRELMTVTNSNPKYVFWNGRSLPQSATGAMVDGLRKLMKDAGLWIKGNVSHRFRDTFVDFSLGSGWSMDEIAAALGDTVTVVERHYANLASKRMEDRLAKLPVRTW
ncbi:MAG: hypothetical protein DMG76_26285 [Acidobacteria bacterium]|nr:MAG: hypothetical protein DMG76_26285 [Acidobacteriota bacterium]